MPTSQRALPLPPDQIARYRGKLSGPLLDRIDLQITVPALASESLRATPDGEPSAVRQRVVAASERQLARQGKTNADLRPSILISIAHWTSMVSN